MPLISGMGGFETSNDIDILVPVIESGWRIGPQEKSGCSMGDMPVHNGDIFQQGKKFILVSLEINKIKQFTNLFSIDYFIGKNIKAKCVKGSRFVGGYGFSRDEDEGDVYIICAENRTSQFLVEARRAVNPFNNRVDFDTLSQIGVFSPEDKQEYNKELKDYKKSNGLQHELMKQRKELQKFLPDSSIIKGKKIYKEIDSIEKQIEGIKAIKWKWADRYISYEYLNQYTKLVELTNCTGKIIKEVSRIEQEKEPGYEFPDILFIKFEDGSISVPVAEINPNKHNWVNFDLEGLKEIEFVSEDQIFEIEIKYKRTQARAINKKCMRDRICELERELDQFNIGRRKTIGILLAIKLLEKEFIFEEELTELD